MSDKIELWAREKARQHYKKHFSGPLSTEEIIALALQDVATEKQKRIDELHACHDAEIGVCFKHCDEVKDLQAKLDRARGHLKARKDYYGKHASWKWPKDEDQDAIDAALKELGEA